MFNQYTGKRIVNASRGQSPLGYERVYLPLHKVADTPFHIQGTKYDSFSFEVVSLRRDTQLQRLMLRRWSNITPTSADRQALVGCLMISVFSEI